MRAKIVIASVLKPVDDVRAYWKLAQSITRTNKGKYDLIILGNQGEKKNNPKDISFYPHTIRRSQFWKRLLIPYWLLVRIWKTQPKLLIITTHELLFIANVYAFFHKCKVVYDVQENHAANILIRPSPIKHLIARIVRLREKVLTRGIDHFLLAETSYQKELSFLKNQSFTILENKAHPLPTKPLSAAPIHLLFSGTLSHYSGAIEALQVMENMIKKEPTAQGLFIGQVHDRGLFEALNHRISKQPNITLNASLDPIPYSEIRSAIQWASLGIISYLPNEINQHKVPTKLYEYSRYQLPYLIQKNTYWADKASQLGGAIAVDIRCPDLNYIVDQLGSPHLFPPSYPKEETWEHEEIKWIQLINDLLIDI